MNIIDTVLSRPEFADNPPVLMDIGASGEIHPKWRRIAPFSVCIAFDADEREMGYTVKESSDYRKLYVFNSIVTAEDEREADFHLTRSPFCSSLLQPDLESLNNWAFRGLFEVERTVRLKATTLPHIMNEIGIQKVDWFKTDSQGTDLRLFASLGAERIGSVLAAEFEPGIMDAYEGEDKLWSLMSFMDDQPFWMSNLIIRGSQRISRDVLSACFSPASHAHVCKLLMNSPGWGEVTYLNTFANSECLLGLREYLLGWVFATIERQNGFAFEIAVRGHERFGDAIFSRLQQVSRKKLENLITGIPIRIARKIIDKISTLIG